MSLTPSNWGADPLAIGHGIITQRAKQISERLQRVFAEGLATLGSSEGTSS